MSSKKARRRQRREQDRSDRRRGLSPVTLFLLGIGLAMVATVAGAMLLADRSGRGEPPWPGAVWSAAHGHWH